LRRFSLSLCHGNEADDLVQGTLLKALTKQSPFIPGTNLRAWLFTIMRNTFITSVKRSAREQPMDDEYFAQRSVGPARELNVRTGEIEASIQRLTTNYRNALMRVGVHGDSYDEAAENLHCALGTVKSRVSRARLLVIRGDDNPPWT
jgi:RNA polymerase sigma-70 factor (ECF subfamily)